ncbi:DNA polymerase epsilon catalytic subunit A [Camellia lanceoleosa]|uniref:DNA polymerase epsilon catalytic subunit A n=1 Tax=Camellia lanceoleosa TaxID=1840588 RepID=A0ACC0GNS5_9ERIC|nr:DNA polymerase epsilon catalytic subunit A [Camellia lanceoleosa]
MLLESETYIGGHVECLESGVFRSDLPTSFKLDPSAYEIYIDISSDGLASCTFLMMVRYSWYQNLRNNLVRDLQYAIRVEGKMELESVSNYDEVKDAIMEKGEETGEQECGSGEVVEKPTETIQEEFY